MTHPPQCEGCTNEFYNGQNPHGITECWSLKTARLVTRYRIGWWTPPTAPGAFTKVETFHCHREPGVNAFMEALPPCAVEPR